MADPYLLVDLAGVLFAFDHDHRLGELGRCLGMPAERVDELLWRSGFGDDCDGGRYPDAEAVRAEVRRITGYQGPDDELDAAWCSAYTPDSEVLAVLDEVPETLRCAVFTNNGPLEEAVLPRLYPAAFAPFHERFFCHRLAANKPDPVVYQHVRDLLDVPAQTISFVDDGEDNVGAARRVGWRATLYREPGDVARLLG